MPPCSTPYLLIKHHHAMGSHPGSPGPGAAVGRGDSTSWGTRSCGEGLGGPVDPMVACPWSGCWWDERGRWEKAPTGAAQAWPSTMSAWKRQLSPMQVLEGFWTQGDWKSLKMWFECGLKLLQIPPPVLPPQRVGTGMLQPCGDSGTHQAHGVSGGTGEIRCRGLAAAPGHGSLHGDTVAWQQGQHSGGDKQCGWRRLGQPEGRKTVAETCWDLRVGVGGRDGL